MSMSDLPTPGCHGEYPTICLLEEEVDKGLDYCLHWKMITEKFGNKVHDASKQAEVHGEAVSGVMHNVAEVSNVEPRQMVEENEQIPPVEAILVVNPPVSSPSNPASHTPVRNNFELLDQDEPPDSDAIAAVEDRVPDSPTQEQVISEAAQIS
ncbi:hypothetical protein IFM89_039922 [Coptis chinensis]|uniref:Uncharacterized protein n=1 Tax=Coptis chinensis TaxID=261450 RepID=A0A835GVF6_9MAGN|nr:hypothetical protein IFM89_039922 [Coptis chinensis]